MGARRVPCNCMLLVTSCLLMIGWMLSLVALVTPEWVHSEVLVEFSSMRYRLTVDMGLFEESCNVEKLNQPSDQPQDFLTSLLGTVVDIFVPIADLCDKQIQERGAYVSSTITLLIIALVIAGISTLLSFVCHFVHRWWLIAFLLIITLLTLVLQITALVVFITGASQDKDKFTDNRVIKNVQGEMRYSMVLQFIAIVMFLITLLPAVMATRSAKRIPTRNVVGDMNNARCSVASAAVKFGIS